MKKLLFTALILTLFSTLGYAQYRTQSNPLEKFYFGGGGGFSGGTDYLNLSVSPLVGYKITPEFSAGLQLTYQYVRFLNTSVSNYGGGPFLRYNFSQNIFAYTQYEYLNFGLIVPNSPEPRRLDFTSWFVGVGYSEPIGRNFAFNITALYNLLYKDGTDSPYRSPLLFRVGIVGGLF